MENLFLSAELFPGEDKSNICMINTNEGSAIQHLTESQSGVATAPVYSDDGQRIFYTRGMASTTYVGNVPSYNLDLFNMVDEQEHINNYSIC